MLAIDLHVHSNRSDGTFSPSALVDYAMEKGLGAFALTDHDTVEGLEEALEYAQRLKARLEAQAAAPSGKPPAQAASQPPTEQPASQHPAEQAASHPQAEQPASQHPAGQAASHPQAEQPASQHPAEQAASHPQAEQPASQHPAGQTPGHSAQERTPSSQATLVPEVIPGIEFSTEYQGRDVHILGLYIDYKNTAFQARLQAFVDSRDARNRKMCLRLQEAGIPITYEALRAEFPDAVITRAHYAKYMLGHGHINSMTEAFDRFIGDHCPCFVPREKVTPVQAVKLVLQAGGVPVLAHPVLYRMSGERLEQLTAELAQAGLGGLEAVYGTYSPAEERQMRALAARHGLLITGGSDFHGANKPGLDLGTGYGRLYVPYCLLEDLRRWKAAH